jgi:hypothetical protein
VIVHFLFATAIIPGFPYPTCQEQHTLMQQRKKIPMRRLGFVITIAAVLAGAAPAAAQQQPAPAPPDQGNGNWDPPPVTKPTTER